MTGNALPFVTSTPEREPTATLKSFCTSFRATAYEYFAGSVSHMDWKKLVARNLSDLSNATTSAKDESD